MSAEPIRVSRGGVFIPEWGNEDRKEADRIRVTYHFLTISEEQQIVTESHRGISRELPDDDRWAEAIGRQWITRASRMIDAVENLSIDDGGEVREITTSDELFAEPALTDLGYEVIHALKNMTAVDKKKLPSASGSGSKGSTGKRSGKKSVTEDSAS